MISKSCSWFFLVLLSTFLVDCDNPTDTDELNVDRDIPLSEGFDASYGLWGPEGETIYFQHSEELGIDPDPGKLDQLWKLNLETGQRDMIHVGRIRQADISPDGQWFVFQTFFPPQYLYKMRSDGTNLQKMTGPESLNSQWEYTGQPHWSPDGKEILFSVTAGEPRGVSLMDSSGTNPEIIEHFGIFANWFPSGNRIVYVDYDTTQSRTRRQQIYIANVDGSNPEKITDLPHSQYIGSIVEPAVSPDGQQIAFANEGKINRDRELFIMDSSGDGVEQVTMGEGYASSPKWSPDGQTILFSRIILNGPKRLYYLDVTTREVTPVFPAP